MVMIPMAQVCASVAMRKPPYLLLVIHESGPASPEGRACLVISAYGWVIVCLLAPKGQANMGVF